MKNGLSGAAPELGIVRLLSMSSLMEPFPSFADELLPAAT